MIPGVVAYVYFGTALSSVMDALHGNFEGGWIQLTILIVGSIVALLVVIYVTWRAGKAIRKVLKEQQ